MQIFYVFLVINRVLSIFLSLYRGHYARIRATYIDIKSKGICPFAKNHKKFAYAPQGANVRSAGTHASGRAEVTTKNLKYQIN